MNSSVAFTTSGSAFGNDTPAVDEFVILMISAAGKRASDVMACVVEPGVTGTGDDAAEGPREERSGVCGESDGVAGAVFFVCGVTGASTADHDETTVPSISSLSSTIFPSAIFARSISGLNKHIARSLFGRLIIRSVISPCLDVSNFPTAAKILSLSDVGATDPEGDELRGGVGARFSLNEIGVDGCSGADAVAFNEAGSSSRESCDADGDGDDLFEGDLLPGFDVDSAVFDFSVCTCSASFAGSWMAVTTSLRERLTRESTMESISFEGTVSIALTRLLSSPVRTSFRTTGDSVASSS